MLVYNSPMGKWIKAGAGLLLIAAPVLIYLLWPTDEARIRKLVREASASLEAEDLDAFMGHVSFQYSDDHGLSYLLLKRLLEREFEVREDIRVSYRDLHVEVKKDKATAVMDIEISARRGHGPPVAVMGGGDERVVLSLTLNKERLGKWLVRSAVWPPAF
jgi:ketosteroid isomerase-like protein